MNTILKENKVYFIGLAFLLFLATLLILQFEKGYFVLYFGLQEHKFIDYLFSIITHCSEAISYMILGILFFFFKKIRWFFALVFIAFISFCLSFSLKLLFSFERPTTYFYKLIDSGDFILIPGIDVNNGLTSFPSGHTISAFALFGFIALISKNNVIKILLLTLASLVGISRIVLSQHFLEDITFGAVIGALVSIVIYYIFQRKEKFFPKWMDSSFYDIALKKIMK